MTFVYFLKKDFKQSNLSATHCNTQSPTSNTGTNMSYALQVSPRHLDMPHIHGSTDHQQLQQGVIFIPSPE